MASTSRIEIEKFNDQNFELWKLKMEDLLVDREQRIVVDSGTKPTGTSQEEWDKLEIRERSTIRLFLSDFVLLNIFGEDSAVNILYDLLLYTGLKLTSGIGERLMGSSEHLCC